MKLNLKIAVVHAVSHGRDLSKRNWEDAKKLLAKYPESDHYRDHVHFWHQRMVSDKRAYNFVMSPSF